MASVLFVLNDGPYGSEKSYSALRHAVAVAKEDGDEVKLFLMADATACAVAGQSTPEGYYSIESMLKGLIAKRAEVGLWGSCMDARGLASVPLIEGTTRSSLDVLAEWTRAADKVIVY